MRSARDVEVGEVGQVGKVGKVGIGDPPTSVICPPQHHNTKLTPTSTRDNSTNMALIDKAIKEMKSHKSNNDFSCKRCAAKYNIS